MKSTIVRLGLGLLLGLTALQGDLAAQGIQIRPDAANALQWDQPAADLAAARAIKMLAKFDGAQPAAVAQTCTGTGTPFVCSVLIPLTFQNVGTHQVTITGANVDPLDTTNISAFVTLVDVTYTVLPPLTPPAPGLRPRIVKVLASLAALMAQLTELLEAIER